MQFALNSLFLALLSLNGAVNAQTNPLYGGTVWFNCSAADVGKFCYPLFSSTPNYDFKCQRVIYVGSVEAVKTTVFTPQKYQCLPLGYQGSSQIFDPSNSTNFQKVNGQYRIWNSWGDDCSPMVGADAGCGSGLQCIYYNKNAYFYPKNPLWKHECVASFVYFQSNNVPTTAGRFQTCGASTDQNLPCSSTFSPALTCKNAPAIVNGVTSTKWVCLTSSGYSKRDKLANLNPSPENGGTTTKVASGLYTGPTK